MISTTYPPGTRPLYLIFIPFINFEWQADMICSMRICEWMEIYMANATIATVIERLDALDGVQDVFYTDHPLRTANSTGACALAEEQIGQLSPLGFPVNVNTTLTNLQGDRVSVNCEVLAQRFNTLINIAQTLPFYRFIPDLLAGRTVEQLKPLTREDLYGFHIVEHMIISLLIGATTTDMSFSEYFALIPYRLYTESVKEMAQIIPNIPPGHLNVENVDQAYDLFEELGRRYGFDPSPFKPPNHR